MTTDLDLRILIKEIVTGNIIKIEINDFDLCIFKSMGNEYIETDI